MACPLDAASDHAAHQKSRTGVTPYGLLDDCRFSGSAAFQVIAELANGCMPAQHYCGSPAPREGMVLPIAGG
jgi:hypothetical protein